jgi:hypothetical protein
VQAVGKGRRKGGGTEGYWDGKGKVAPPRGAPGAAACRSNAQGRRLHWARLRAALGVTAAQASPLPKT